MTGQASEWTVNTLKEHVDALRAADERFDNERDRRNTEVKTAEEKALHVKEVADAEALRLARESSITKDLQAEKLRDQVGSAEGVYATRDDLLSAIDKVMEHSNSAIKEVMDHVSPVIDYVSSQQGRSSGLNAGWVYLGGAVALLATFVSVIVAIVSLAGS